MAGGTPTLAAEIGARLRLLRRRAGVTTDALAARVGVNRNSVHNWENGRTSPTAANLLLLARAFGVTPGEILDPVYAVMRFGEGVTDG
jgi:transcriptional regulator with XRE-family HTH domain